MRSDTAEANARAAEANKAAEEVRRENIELEKAVAPRSLEQVKSSAALKIYAGTKVHILFVPDFETRRLAGMIAVMLDMAQWTSVLTPHVNAMLDGITVLYIREAMPPFPSSPFGSAEWQEHGKLVERIREANGRRYDVAAALTQQLNASNLSAHTQVVSAASGLWPAGVSHDAVGLKPMKYCLDKAIREQEKDNPGGNIIRDNRR